jgi:hypothetical protein
VLTARARLLATACALLAGAVVAPAAGAAAPALAATTVVTGTITGYADVTLTRPLVVADATPNVTVRGSGFVAVVLVRLQRGIAPPGLAVSTLPGTSTLHHHWIGHARGTFADDDQPTFFTHRLPAGRYRLYLVTHGPVTVTWRLPLGGGRATVTARTRTADTRAVTIPAGTRGVAVAPGYAATATTTFAHRGVTLAWSWYEAAADVAAATGGCTYPGAPSTDGLGPAPACLDRDASKGPVGPAVDDRLVGQGTAFTAPGTWTSKQYARVAGVVRDGGASVLLLDLGTGFPGE